MHRRMDDSQLLVQILPSGVHSLHLAGRIGENLARLEKSLIGIGEAAVKRQFQNLKEVRWDRKAELDAEDAEVSACRRQGGLCIRQLSRNQVVVLPWGPIPPANFENPYWSQPDSDDFE
ncbi:hypothetical protein BDW71DRAFT_186153 [Aspergillus fruticulosus]